MKIAIGSDHGGFNYKEAIKQHLLKQNIDVIDVGAKDGVTSVNYPSFGIEVGKKVASKQADLGIVVCTSGEGITIAANKVKGVRAGIGYDDLVTAKLIEHNDANVIGFGQAYMKLEDVIRRVDIFLNSKFEGGRHTTRVDIISDFEKEN